jgi:outer membrane protein
MNSLLRNPEGVGSRIVLKALVATLVLGYTRADAQYAPVEIDTLTARRAADLAIAYHPSVRGAEAGVRSASGAYRQAFAAYLPTLSFSASDTHNEGVFVFTPTSGTRNQIYSTYAASLSAQQTVFDFGRTIGRVSASSDLVDASLMDEAANRNTLVMNVEIAYYAVMQSARVVRVNEEALDAAQRHLTQAKAFYSVGRRPQLDVTKAEVDLANANVNLIRARNALQVARVQLENTIGVRLPTSVILPDTFAVSAVSLGLDSLRSGALSQRPELLAARARLGASSSLITAAWTQHLPVLSASGSYNWSNFETTPLYPRWIAAVTLSIPIFQGFAIDAQVQQARANEEIARATMDQLAQSVLLEVEQNYLALKEAQERLGATIKLVEEADQALVLAERQYAAGVGTQLDVTDAQLTRSDARITNIQALFDLNSSLVRLHRSVGLMP